MAIKTDTVLMSVLVMCAVVVTGLMVRREFASPKKPPPPQPEQIQNWRAHISKGVTMGAADAPVQLIEFADFECPACGAIYPTLKTIRERYPGKVALTFIHFPLEYHRFAEPAARAVECAADQGYFEGMYGLLFEQQKSLGSKTWNEFATEAGVADIPAFEACTKRTEAVPRIADGKAAGKDLVRGTPTLIINGWKLVSPPQLEELDEMVKNVLAGKSPIPESKRVARAG